MEEEKNTSKEKSKEELENKKPTIEIDLAEEKPKKDFIKIRKPENDKS